MVCPGVDIASMLCIYKNIRYKKYIHKKWNIYKHCFSCFDISYFITVVLHFSVCTYPIFRSFFCKIRILLDICLKKREPCHWWWWWGVRFEEKCFLDAHNLKLSVLERYAFILKSTNFNLNSDILTQFPIFYPLIHFIVLWKNISLFTYSWQRRHNPYF